MTTRGGKVYRQRLMTDVVPEDVVTSLALTRLQALITNSKVDVAPLPRRWHMRLAGVIDADVE